MNKLSLILILFCSFSFIFLFGCKKVNNATLYESNNINYLLVSNGDTSRFRNDLNIINSSNTIKHFFADTDNELFNMNYKVIPDVETIGHPQKCNKILEEVETFSSKLESESSFVWFYLAHGGEDGDFACEDGIITPEEIISALAKGRVKNGKVEPFKRFIIMAQSCYSGAFMIRFKNNYKNMVNKKEIPPLFKEGIYIASSGFDQETWDGDLTTGNWNVFLPVLLSLRFQQLHSSSNYDTTYSEVKRFLTGVNLLITPFDEDILNGNKISLEELITSKISRRNDSEKSLIKTPRTYNRNNPTVKDIKDIMGNLKVLTPELPSINHFTMDIDWDNPSSKNSSIF